MDPSKFAGMSWDVWANHVENQSKEQFVKVESNVNKLQKEDMKIFGQIVDSEPLNFHVCEKCDMVVKAQALLHHYSRKHTGTSAEGSSCEKSSPKMIEMKDSSDIVSSLVTSYSCNLFIKDNDGGSTSDVDVANENIKDKKKFTSPPLTASRRLKRLETNRSPLGQMCSNKWHNKKKESRAKSKLKDRTFRILDGKDPLMTEKVLQNKKMETNSETNESSDGVDYLLHQLPGMTLNSAVEEQACGDDTIRNSSPNNSVSYLSSPPRALSATPLFSCHKAGGLLYPGRHMKMTRKRLQQMFNNEFKIPTNLLQQMKARRKNLFSRRKK